MRFTLPIYRRRLANGHVAVDDGVPWRSVPRPLLSASPLLFGIPVTLGIVVSVLRLLSASHPDLGWAGSVNDDALELYRGHTLYQNPANGYTGLLYTPLFPVLIGLLYHIYFWGDWPDLLAIGASASLVVLTARVAYTPTGPHTRAIRIAGAIGIGAVAYWCVASIPLAVLDEARADQLAWAFALFGLIAVADFGSTPSRRRVVLAALLLSAGIWTKQTTIGVAVLSLAWVLTLAAAAALARGAAWIFAAALVGVNLGLLLVLNLLTEGWEFFITVEMATRQATHSAYGVYFSEGLQSIAMALGFIGATWLAIAVSGALRRRRSAPPRSRRGELIGGLRSLLAAENPTGRRTVLLGLYAVPGFAMAIYFLRKQGTETNQFIGVGWVLGLFAATGWHIAQRHARTAAAAGGCIALYFGLSQLGPVRALAANAGVIVPELEQAAQWPQLSPELLSWAAAHTFYAPNYADLDVRRGEPLYPDFVNLADKLAAGYQPRYFVQALLDRHFESVAPFSLAEEGYTSAYGKWEEGYLWKLDEVIAARYVAAPGTPEGVLVRRSGPEREAWMRDCFGPFVAGGASFRIHRGGGFWCSFAPNRLALVRTPGALSEVVTTQPVAPSGALTVSLEGHPPAAVELVLGAEGGEPWTARVAALSGRARELAVSSYLGARSLGSALVGHVELRGGRRSVRLELTPSRRQPGPPVLAGVGTVRLQTPLGKALFALVASPGAAIDLNALSFGR